MSSNYLGTRGYVIHKSDLNYKEIEEIKNDLTMSPFNVDGYGAKPIQFKIYLESTNKLYLPKSYGLQKFGVPSLNKLNQGTDINVPFTGILRPLQIDATTAVLNACNDPLRMGGLLCLQCGEGKCLGKDTEIMMYDGTLKFVQNIIVGDVIMGDDSLPRNILTICKGKEIMYKIISNKGKQNESSYIVNKSHILSLKYLNNGPIIDISITEYLNLPYKYRKSLKGYKVPIDFQDRDIDKDFEPYMVGYWLGCTKINTIRNRYTHKLAQLLVIKHIPMMYKCNSRKIRLDVLAGILDSSNANYIEVLDCNKKYKESGFSLSLYNEAVMEDVIFLARSLGFDCHKKKKYGLVNNYFKTFISGNGLENIPIKNPIIISLKSKKYKDVNIYKIELQKLEIDEYYGFEIDGNRRFVLGDFTVTHNTISSISMISTLAKKTLIIVHKDFLLQQWKERILEFAPSARIGLIKAKIIDIENKDIVIAMLQSLSMKNYEESVFKDFGTVVLDECFPYKQHIVTKQGSIAIGILYNMWKNNEELPLIKTLNIKSSLFEWKKITYAWEKKAPILLKIKFNKNKNKIKCTPNHKILTVNGMIEANKLKVGDLVIANYSKVTSDNEYGTMEISSITENEKVKNIIPNINININISVYDIEVEDNHNFICCSKRNTKGIVVSNCHHLGAEVFSQALQKINFKYSIGLTATPKRKDGLTKVFTSFLGDIAYTSKKRKDILQVNFKKYYSDDSDYSKVHSMYNNKPNMPKMINNICEYLPRVEFIINEIVEILKNDPNRKFLVLSDRRNHLCLMKDLIDTKIINKEIINTITSAFYYGGLKEIQLKEAELKQIIFGTFQMASEGLDIKGLDTLVIASPKSDVIQICGRILRDKPEDRKYTPLILDIVDDFSLFTNQGKKRYTYYKKCKYTIIDQDSIFKEAKKEKDIVLKNICLIE